MLYRLFFWQQLPKVEGFNKNTSVISFVLLVTVAKRRALQNDMLALILCKFLSANCTMHNVPVHCTLYTVQYTLYCVISRIQYQAVNTTLYSVHCMYSVYCLILYSCTVYTVQCLLLDIVLVYSVQCLLLDVVFEYSVHCTVFTV